MNDKKKVDPLRLGAVIAFTLAIIGLVFGIFAFVAMDMASAKIESSMDGVFTFMKHNETNVAMFGGMSLRIGKYVGDGLLKKAVEEKDEETAAKIKKIFPKEDIEEYEVEDIKKSLGEIQGVLVSESQRCIGNYKWLVLLGFIFGFGIIGFIAGILGGKFYNLLTS